jgi:transposase-like protein
MKNRKTYTGDFKAKVVLDLLCKRKNLIELATEHDLHPNQIKNWKSMFLKQADNIFQDKRRTEKRNK